MKPALALAALIALVWYVGHSRHRRIVPLVVLDGDEHLDAWRT